MTSTTVNLNFRSSEFVLYTSEKLPTPELGIIQEDFVTDIPEEIIPEGSFRIFPNPTNGQLFVDLPVEMAGSEFRIIDMQGQILNSGRVSNSGQILELDVRNIQAGIYIFEAYDTKRVLIKRFIKN